MAKYLIKNKRKFMNREILFRGKRLDNQQWVIGTYFMYKGNHGIIPIETVPHSTNCFGQSHNISVFICFIDEATLGQFTGFTDAGKAKLFDGDTIENDGVHLVISFCEDAGCWEATEMYGDKDTFSLSEFANSPDTWLQSNIHDFNP